MRCCLWTEIPHRILDFAWAHRRPGSKLECDSTPCFPWSRWRSSPAFNTLLSYVPSVNSELAAVEISPSGRDLIFSPTELFLVFSALDIYWGSKVSASVLSRLQIFLSLCCASVAMDWFRCFFSDLCLDQVEKTVSLTCGSLFPATCFTRPVLKVPGSGCFCTF